MPPRRRGAASAAQSTLSFGSQSRVTKPATAPSTLHKAKVLDSPASLRSDKSVSGTPEPQQVLASEPSKPHVAELVVRQQATEEHQEPLTEEDQRALKLDVKDLQRYWKKEEQSRKAPRGKLNWPPVAPVNSTHTWHFFHYSAPARSGSGREDSSPL